MSGSPIADLLARIRAELPPARCGAAEPRSVDMSTRDGIALRTHLHLPAGKGPWPVVLIRNPYPGLLGMLRASVAPALCEHEYAVAVQECRGTGSSAGAWVPFLHERGDGLDAIEWIAGQEWADGNVGMYGFSYLAMVQWLVADALPQQVKALFLGVGGTERHRQMYMGGMFRHDIYTIWAVQSSGVKTGATSGELYARALRARPHIEMDRRLFGRELPWYREWVTRPDPRDPYWTRGLWADLRMAPARTRVPVHMIGGWFDHHLDGMACAWENLADDARSKSRFVIGPWDHSLSCPPGLDYPGADICGLLAVKAALEWFDHHLKGRAYGRPVGAVEAYVVGEARWSTFSRWPPQHAKRRLHLGGTFDRARAARTLAQEPDAEQTRVSFRYDPEHPVPTHGGSALLSWLDPTSGAPARGSVEQPECGFRDDVLCFLSEPLAEPLRIAGRIVVGLRVASDAEDTSFTAKIMEALGDGRTFNICDGIASLAFPDGSARAHGTAPAETMVLTIEMWPVLWTLHGGSRIRLDVASSNFPMYHAHPNVRGSWAEQTTTRVAVQSVILGGCDCGSWIELPVSADRLEPTA